MNFYNIPVLDPSVKGKVLINPATILKVRDVSDNVVEITVPTCTLSQTNGNGVKLTTYCINRDVFNLMCQIVDVNVTTSSDTITHIQNYDLKQKLNKHVNCLNAGYKYENVLLKNDCTTIARVYAAELYLAHRNGLERLKYMGSTGIYHINKGLKNLDLPDLSEIHGMPYDTDLAKEIRQYIKDYMPVEIQCIENFWKNRQPILRMS